MKRRDRGQRGGQRAARSAGRGAAAKPGRRRLRMVLGVVGVLVAIALAAWVWRVASRRPMRASAPQEALSDLALKDSAGAALDAKDWEGATRWIGRLAEMEPRDTVYLRELGIAWHNLAWLGVHAGRPRPASRTSLDRATADLRALALLDSAAAIAHGQEDWILSREISGQIYETAGLPLDALPIYAEIRQRAPSYSPVLVRVSWVLSLLRDPLTPPRAAAGAALDVRPR
jgi:hypothetical protein